jgi:large subunit ribosomal protein L21
LTEAVSKSILTGYESTETNCRDTETMYAIFEAKGKQFRAEPEKTLMVPTLDAEPGETVTFDQVLLAGRDDEVIIGRPSLEGASIRTEVVRHGRGPKIIVYKMKRRKGYRRKQGHRQGFTEIRILDIDFGAGRSVRPPEPEAPKKKPAQPKAEKPAAARAEKPAAAQVEKPAKEEAKAAKADKPAEAKAEKPAQPKAEKPAKPKVEIEATDSARELAAEAGIDLATLEGTGKEGRILKSDVQKAIKEQEGS